VRRTVAGLAPDGHDDRMELYPFRYFDQVRKRWVNASYKATLEDITARYERFEITGVPEIRSGNGGQFEPPGER
jgi:hypothetical protein